MWLSDEPAAPRVALVLFCCAGVAFQLSLPLNHDVAWLLVATNRLLDGAHVYVDDVIEVNPPLVLWLFSPGVALARVVGAPEIEAVRLYVVACVLAALALANALLARLLGADGAQLRRWLLAAAAFAFLVGVGYDFAQRDYLVTVFALPWILAVALRIRGATLPPTAWGAVGLTGGLALSLKPHYALAFAGLEIFIALSTRRWRAWLRPEVAVLALVGAAYLAAVSLSTPGYFDVVLPLAADVYWVLERPFAEVVRPADLLVAFALAGALLAVTAEPARSLARALAVAAAGFYAVMLLQGTGMTYHREPAYALALLLVVLIVHALAVEGRERVGAGVRRPFAAGAVSAALSLVLVAVQPRLVERTVAALRDGDRGAEGIVARLVEYVDAEGGGEPIYFLSVPMHPAFPVVNYSGAQWASRFSHLWILHATAVARAGVRPAPDRLTPERLDALDRYLVASLVEDLVRTRPSLVFVDHRKLEGVYPVDLLGALLHDARFARVWSGYELTDERIGPFQVARRRS